MSGEIIQQLKQLTAIFRQRNLDNALQPAILACRGQGPLVDHFCELGRRFGGELEKAGHPAPKPSLRVIDGGVAT